MKLRPLIFATLVAIVVGCHPNPANYHIPAGYHTCRSDNDCRRSVGEFCGFVGVDTYAVCRQ